MKELKKNSKNKESREIEKPGGELETLREVRNVFYNLSVDQMSSD